MNPGDGVLPAMIAFPAVMMAMLGLVALCVAGVVGIYRGVSGRRDDPEAGTWPAIVYGLCLVVAGIAWPVTGRWWYLPAMILVAPVAWALTRLSSPLWRPIVRGVATAGRQVGRALARAAVAIAVAARAVAIAMARAAALLARLVGRAGRLAWHGMRQAAFVAWPIVRGALALAATALWCLVLWLAARLVALGIAEYRRLRTWSKRDSAVWRRRYEWLHS